MLAALVAGIGMIPFLRKETSELPVYVRGGERMLAGEAIYRPAEQKPFTYPPFFALPFVPLALLPEVLHRPIWYLLNLGALCWIFVLCRRSLQPMLAKAARGPPAWLFWLAVVLLAGRHLSSVLENQSHDYLVFLAIMLGIEAARRGRELGAGAWLGIAAAMKATPLLFAPVLLWQRRFVAVSALGFACIACTLLPDAVTPQADDELWAQSWYTSFVSGIRPGETAEAEGAWSSWNYLNQNLAGTLYRLGTYLPREEDHAFDVSLVDLERETLRLLTLAAQGAVLAFLLLVTWHGRRAEAGEAGGERVFRRFGEAGAVCAAMVLLSPMSSKSHFCVLLVPIAFCVADFCYRKRDPAVAALLALVLASGTLTVKGIWGSGSGNRFLAHGSVTLCALATLAACGHVLFHARRAKARAPGSRHGQPR